MPRSHPKEYLHWGRGMHPSAAPWSSAPPREAVETGASLRHSVVRPNLGVRCGCGSRLPPQSLQSQTDGFFPRAAAAASCQSQESRWSFTMPVACMYA